MNRSKHLLLATAVAAALAAAGAAQAETTLFGRAGMAVVNSDGFPGGNGNHAWDVRADDSYLGVQGSEDLGGGLSAVYFYKFVVNADGSASGQPFDQKESWVGLKGDFGRVVAGRMEGPYDNLIDSSGLMDFTGTPFQLDPGITNSTVRYDTPKLFGGLTLSLAVAADGPGRRDALPSSLLIPTDTPRDNVDLYIATALYKAHGIRAGVGYIKDENTDADQWGVDLRYGNDDFQIGGTYEDGDVILPNARGWGIAGQLNFGNNVIIAHGGRRTTDLTAAELDEYALGVQHWFSKRTHVYAEYQHVDFKLDALEDADTVALGLRHDF